MGEVILLKRKKRWTKPGGIIISIAGGILIIQTIPLFIWYAILGFLIVCLLVRSIYEM